MDAQIACELMAYETTTWIHRKNPAIRRPEPSGIKSKRKLGGSEAGKQANESVRQVGLVRLTQKTSSLLCTYLVLIIPPQVRKSQQKPKDKPQDFSVHCLDRPVRDEYSKRASAIPWRNRCFPLRKAFSKLKNPRDFLKVDFSHCCHHLWRGSPHT